MQITATALNRDSVRFIRNQLITFIVISLILTIITTILTNLLSLSPEERQIILESIQKFINTLSAVNDNVNTDLKVLFVQQLSDVNQKIRKINQLLTIIWLIQATFALGINITLISIINEGDVISLQNIMIRFIISLPKLFIVLLIYSLVVKVGLGLFILPGILILIFFFLTPLLVVTERQNILKNCKLSILLMRKNFLTALPAFLIWVVAQIFINSAIINMLLSSSIFTLSYFVFIFISQFLNLFAIVYLFRFCNLKLAEL